MSASRLAPESTTTCARSRSTLRTGVSGECRCDVLREQHAASVDPEGPLDACGVELGKRRGSRPGLAIARSGGRLADIGPQPGPGGIGVVDHPGIVAMIAKGVTDETAAADDRLHGITFMAVSWRNLSARDPVDQAGTIGANRKIS
jgi:hypothetical protein